MNKFIIRKKVDCIPKLMENLRGKLLAETRRQLFESGYASLNIRAIAKSCNIASGTVYNYFSSKELLTATVVLVDWQETVNNMKVSANDCTGLEEGLSAVYGLLLDFYNMYRKIFNESLMNLVGTAFKERHVMLRAQISENIEQVIVKFCGPADDFLCDFIAENFLIASREAWSFNKIAPFLMKLIN